MQPFLRRPAPPRSFDPRPFALASALALLGGLVVAHAPAAREAASAAEAAEAVVRSVAGTVTCSLSAPCLSEANRSSGSGVAASSSSGTGLRASSSAGAGVAASSSSGTGLVASSRTGVAAILKSLGPSGLEIYNGGSAAGADVYALDSTPAGNAIYAASERGIAGYFQNTSSAGVANADVALVARAATTGARSPVFDIANGENEAMASFDDSGDLTLAGELYTAGGCSQGCTRNVRVVGFAPRESEPTAEDSGEARLVAGRAEVSFERAFANSIDARRPYLVSLTPEGETRGLYVASRDARGFVVREAAGGRSNAAFAYRISAKPFGVRDARLPAVELPAPAHDVRAGLGR
jgi:hypothetical protein